MAPLRSRLLAGFLLVTVLALGSAWGVSRWFARSLIIEATVQLASDKAALVSRYFPSEKPVWEPWFANSFFTREKGYSFTFFDLEGTDQGHSSNRPFLVPLSSAARNQTEPHIRSYVESILHPEPAVTAVYPIYYVRNGHHVTGWLQTLVPLRPKFAPLATLDAVFAILILAALAAGIWSLTSGLRPWTAALAMASDTARDWLPIPPHNTRLFCPPAAPEIRPLIDNLNAVLDRVSRSHSQHQQFLADASHELRTPLTILRGEIEVALRRDRSGPEYREVLASGAEELERLSALVDDLLTLARADAGEASGPTTKVGVRAVCEEVANRLAECAGRNQVTLAVEGDAATELEIHPLSLDRIVFNLAENALRHSPPGEAVVIRIETEPTAIQLNVIDNGRGIDAAHLPRLFDRFYRVDSSRTRAHGGAGLGLAIVKALAESAHGTVSVSSRVGFGSTFSVRFPKPQHRT